MAPSPENSPSQDTPNSSPSPTPSKNSSQSPPSNSNSSSPTPPNSNSSSPPQDNDNSSPSTTWSPPSPAYRSPPPPKSSGRDDSAAASPPPKSSKSSSSEGSSSKYNNDTSPSPTSSQSSSRKSTSSSDKSSLDTKVIIGVAVGAGLLLVVLVLFLTRCLYQKKKKKKIHYYDYTAPDAKGGQQYYMGAQQAHWQNSPAPNHVFKIPPPAGMGGSPASWGAPPHPQGLGSSGEASSSFSDPHRSPMPPPSPGISLGFSQCAFACEELAAATNGFSDAYLLGQGGFGYVHKGVLANGKEVAVKSLKFGSGQGEREFQAEVEIISRIHHRHLVSLVGYCIAGGQRMLVYDFVPNRTLEYHLHRKGLPVMDFSTRLRIALGAAKGLAYLHEDCHPRIIHRDIKSANILLDNKFEAMVADFGLAKLSSDNYTHVSTRVMGTFGYLAPEYASSGKLTEKSDVFSFGVMLLEIITGKPPVDRTNAMEDSLVDWARPLMAQAQVDGNYDQLADPRLERRYNPNEMACMVTCAAASIRHSAKKRPKMSQIVRALEGGSSLLDDLNEGVKPGQSTFFGSSGATSDYSQSSYNADLKRFRELALSGEECNNNDHGTSSSGNASL
ncbi:hypothetical protein SLA2020_514660 [Shorea laevis]